MDRKRYMLSGLNVQYVLLLHSNKFVIGNRTDGIPNADFGRFVQCCVCAEINPFRYRFSTVYCFPGIPAHDERCKHQILLDRTPAEHTVKLHRHISF